MTFLNFPKFFIIAVIGCLTMPGVLLGPAIVGILVDNANFSENYAGWAMACSSAGSALTLIVISGFMHQINLKQLSYICLSLAFIIDIYCSFKVDPSIHFLVLRFIIGVVATIANIAVYTSIASFKNYERGYGLFVMMQYSASGLGLYYLILYADVIGASGLYQILAALNLIALLLINQLPDLNTHTQTMKNETSEIAVLFSKVVVIAIIGFGLHEMSSVAQFTFIERVGASIGIENQSLGNILLAGSLVGIPGSMICIVIGNKYGLFKKGYRQVCIYSFPRNKLMLLKRNKKKTPFEQIEDIEILRFLELGEKVHMIKLSSNSISVDTLPDYIKAQKVYKKINK